jgi:hypothetical protein
VLSLEGVDILEGPSEIGGSLILIYFCYLREEAQILDRVSLNRRTHVLGDDLRFRVDHLRLELEIGILVRHSTRGYLLDWHKWFLRGLGPCIVDCWLIELQLLHQPTLCYRVVLTRRLLLSDLLQLVALLYFLQLTILGLVILF